MSINWEQYLQEVMPNVAGCPIIVAENAIRNSAIEFATESRSWREQITDVTLAQGVTEYALAPLADSEVIALHKVKFADQAQPLSTIPPQHLDNARISTTQQRPRWFNQPTPAEIEVILAPDQAYTLEVHAILKPTKASTSGPDFFYNDWLDAISAGATARLLAMGREWGDKSMVNFHKKIFIKGWVDARIRDAKGNVQSSSRLRPGSFGQYRGSRTRRY